MDTPGILWPKFEDKTVGINLAVTGAIKDEIIDTVELASILLEHLSKLIRRILRKDTSLNRCRTKGYELLEEAGKKRGCIISGGEVDLTRIAAIVLDEFRGGKIGRITLERPGDAVQELVAD